MASNDEELKDIIEKFKKDIENQVEEDYSEFEKPRDKVIFSREYMEFKRDARPAPHTVYEKLCNYSEKILKIKPDAKKKKVLEDNIKISHLDITAEGATSLTVLAPLMIILFGVGGGMMLFGSGFFVLFALILSGMVMLVLNQLPAYFSNSWRLKASNQMVICIFYVATYMRHTSNIENAIVFAAEHILPPLSLDLKRVLWNVETEEYESVKESLDAYLETWRKWNLEFIESFHLIEASLFEPSNARRLSIIDKALEVILQETYEKMLHYAHNLKNPITMLHMLGVIMPILGLVILPLAVNFMDGLSWQHIAMLYNFVLPVFVFYMGKNILSSRPTGYGDTDITETNPELKKYKNIIIKLGKTEIKINPIYYSILIWLGLFFIGVLPLMIHAIDSSFDVPFGDFLLLDYRESKTISGKIIGPFGLGAAMLSLFVPLSFGLAIGLYYHNMSKNVIKIRQDTKQLEKEFASGLFLLGNRIGDGLPVEMAFGKVSEIMQGTKSGEFFKIVNTNISKAGMSVKQAIFNKSNGAIIYFPSNIIESAMEILLQSSKKGPKICSQALINISQYIKEIHRVDERLKDLLAEIISSMKSQVGFLAPAIAGIVVGITSMVSTIIGALSGQIQTITNELPTGAGGVNIDFFGDGMPTYYFQIVVGIYIVQIIYILTILANGIENGSDKLSETFLLGQNLIRGTILYVVISAIIIMMFNLVVIQILGVTMAFG